MKIELPKSILILKKSITKNKIIIIALLILMNTLSFAQMIYWTMPPLKVVMPAAPPSQQPLFSGAPSTGAYGVANGAYDANGSLVFYVKDDYVYDPNGTSIGHIGYDVTNQALAIASFPVELGGELVIVPIPGECKKYYVIFSRGALMGGSYMYIKVDCSSGTPVIGYADGITRNHVAVGNYRLAYGLGSSGLNNTGLAVTRMYSSGNSAYYYLYSATNNGIYYHIINSTGIGVATTIGAITAGFFTTELELSPNGKWLSWISSPGTVNVIYLNLPTSRVSTSFQSYNYPAQTTINGIEFGGNYNNPSLYVAGNTSGSPIIPVFERITITNSTPARIPLSLGGANFNNTFIEYGKNGNIYGIHDDGNNLYLTGFNENTSVVTGNIIKVNSNHSNLNNVPPLNNVFTLPDQIDGEDYSNFSPFPIVTLDQIAVNTNPFQNNCSGTFIELYNCAPMTIDASYIGGEPCNYDVKIDPVDQYCNLLSHNNYFSYGYGEGIASDSPLDGLDLRDLYANYEYSLYNQPGYYRVTVDVYDCCGTKSTQVAYIRVLQAVSPTLNLEIYDTYYNVSLPTPVPFLPASQSILSPILTGALTAQFRIDNSSGAATSYNVTIDQVNSAEVIIKNIYNKTVPVANIAGIAIQGLNSLCYPASAWAPTVPGGGSCTSSIPAYSGYTGYFGYSNGLLTVGNYYKISVTLNNQCSGATNYSYIYVDNGYAKPTGVDEIVSEKINAVVYPNPASDQIRLDLKSEKGGTFNIAIYDITGRLVKPVDDNFRLDAEVKSINVDIRDLESGVYIYKISSDSEFKNGIITINH